MLKIDFDEKNMKFMEEMLKESPKKVPQAMVSVLNRVAQYGKTTTATQITKIYTPMRQDVSKSLGVIKANEGNLEGGIDARGRRIPLIYFKTTPQIPQPRTPVTTPVTTEVKAGAKHTLTKLCFTAKMKSGHRGVFRRRTKASNYDGRLPIEQLYGPSVPQMFGNEKVLEVVEERVGKNFESKMIEEVIKVVEK